MILNYEAGSDSFRKPYFRRDFAFTLAMTAKGETTVKSTRAKINPKPNMSLSLSSDFSVGQGLRTGTALSITHSQWVIPGRLQGDIAERVDICDEETVSFLELHCSEN